MLLTLYDQYGNEKAELQANDSSTQDKEVQADNVLSLGFTLYEHVPIDVNDYVDFGGERYWAVEKYEPAEKSSVEWEYSLKLYGIESLIKRFLVLNNTDGDNEAVFTLTARPVDHVRLIVKCINDGMDQTTNFKVGSVEGTDNVVIEYTGKYCHEALKELAEAVGTEWWIEGDTLNLCRCEHGEEVTLGYDNGLTALDRDLADVTKFYTRLFPVGSTRNIDAGKYGHSRLMLPDGARYVDVNVDKYGIIHHYEQSAFADIYPRRVGVVSSVRQSQVKDNDGNPFTIYYFKDNDMPFDPNEYELAGLVKRVSFQEGSELAGLGADNDHYFEVNFNSETREFEIITIWPYDDDTQLPGGTLVPKVGDKYILWNICMPDEYYGLAEQELRSAVDEYNRKHALDVSRYKAPTDHVWMEDTGTELFIGQRIRLESREYFPETGYRQSRITRISRKVNLPGQMDLEISDALSTGVMTKIDDAITGAKNYAGALVGAINVPDIIRSWDTTPPTDTNLYSARRMLKEFLNKNTPDVARELITFLKGIAVGDGSTGIDADGVARLRALLLANASIDADGNAELRNITNSGVITTKHLNVLGKAIFHELEIEKSKSVAGMLIVSPGAFKIDHVEEGYTDDNGVYHSYMDDNLCTGGVDAAYRCYGLAADADGNNLDLNIEPGDQVFCQTFTSGSSGNRYYWRRVLAASNTPVVKKDQDGVDRAYHWIDISLDDYDELSEGLEGIVNDYPAPGDEVAVFGHNWGILTDSDRQSVIVISSYSSVDPDMMPPYIAQYAGLDNYDLRAHRTTFFSFGKNEITGTVRMSAESRLPDGSKVKDTIGSMQKYINDAQYQDDKQIVIWFGEEVPTADNAPAVDWDTEEVRQAHEGDIYYNRSSVAGGRAYCYKLTADGAGHEWQEITDGDVLGALEAAARAQDTADGKRTVFTARPTDAGGRYTQDIDVGDMWVDAVFPAVGDPGYTIDDVTYTADNPLYNGDILVCRMAMAAGNEFSIAHWAPAQAITSRRFKSTIESLGARISLSITDLLTGLEAVGIHLIGETKKIVLNSATTEMTGDLKLKGVLQESTKCYGKGCLVPVDMETTKSITLDNISPAYPDANGWGSIVVLPQINSVVLNDRITMPGYAEAGVHLTVKVAAEKDFSAWGAVDNSSISGPYNDRNKIAALNARMVMVCADARILASSNIPGTAGYIKPSGADPWRLNSYYHGMFSMHGALSRLVLMLPGQSLHLVSSIEYYETPSGLEPYLVWNVENYGDFVNISKRVVFRRDGEDVDDNQYSRIFGTHAWFDYPYPTMDPDIGYSTSLFGPEQLGDDYIHPQYTDTVPAVEVSAALGEDDPRLSIVFYE